MKEATAKWPRPTSLVPDGLTRVEIDAFTGMRAGPGSPSVEEWFIAGTEPQDRLAPADLRHRRARRRRASRKNVPGWMDANRDWIRRAERGPGVLAAGPDANELLLQPRLPSVWLLVGGCRRPGLGLR